MLKEMYNVYVHQYETSSRVLQMMLVKDCYP